MKKHTYLGLYTDGQLNTSAQIHHWHDDKHLTVEYLDYISMTVWVSTGREPSFTPIEPEATHDIDLDDLPDGYDSYKLHYTWLTIARDFIKGEKAYQREQEAQK